MKTFQLEDFTGAIDNTSDHLVEEWKVNALTDYLASITNNEENT
jgi:hypothetical protein